MADKVWEDTKNFETNLDEPNPNRFKTGRDILAEDAGSVFLTRMTPGSRLSPWHNSDFWDFAIWRPPIEEGGLVWVKETWELKADWKSAETNNVFFESWNNNKNEPSGMRRTKAEWWAHYLPGEQSILTFKVKEMKEHLTRANKNDATVYRFLKRAGDNGNARGVLVETELIKALDFVIVRTKFGF